MPVIWRRNTGGTRYEVRAHGATRRLYSDGVFHSAWNPRNGLTGRVWDLFLVAAFAGARPIRRILMLGIGGGTSLLQFRRFLGPVDMTGVELDPVHVEIAREYFNVDASVAELVQADARDWVAGYDGPRFDLVVDDLFGHVGGEPLRAVLERPAALGARLLGFTPEALPRGVSTANGERRQRGRRLLSRRAYAQRVEGPGARRARPGRPGTGVSPGLRDSSDLALSQISLGARS